MPTALIVGAGIGGLAAGIAFRRAGWDVRIFERAPSPRDIGFGLGLAPNAIAALSELGLRDAVIAQAITPTAAELRRPDGRVIRRFVAQRADLPAGDLTSVILRPTLHKILIDAVGARAIETNRAALRFQNRRRDVELELSDATTAVGDILLGADGVGSTIRAQLHPREGPAQPSGYFAVRGLSPAVERLNGLHVLWYFGRGVESGVVQASATGIYWFLSLFAEDVNAGPTDVNAVTERLAAGFDEQFHAIVGATTADNKRIDELLVREPLRHWGSGRVTLAGDAAHPMLPHTGQGAAQALEDAVALGRALTGPGDVVSALRDYERVRSRRTERVVRMGPRIARITTTKNPLVGLLRDVAFRLMPESALIKAFTQAGAQARR
jgi:2-polyprenyl-6-methoxyphenol hydroxylase-like FAD-dependent oxidoreductase